MSKHYSYLISSAIIEGIFVGVYIKTGIDAAHKLDPPTPDDAENIINFTSQLLKTIYEMEFKMKKFVPAKNEKLPM